MCKYILAFEASCDETSCAVFNIKKEKILSCIIKSQIDIHKKIGGVIPDRAAQEHLIYIDLVLEEALSQANLTIDNIDYIACTNGPGLPGALLIGFNFAKSLAWKYSIPFIPVNHIEGHVYSAGIEQQLQFPFLCLSVSGGHTAVYRVDNFSSYTLLSNTQDDAAGELFDKVSNLIGLGYPGGAILEKYAKEIFFKDNLNYPRLKKDTGYLSFSGLKTAVLYDLIKRGLYNLQQKRLSRELLVSEKQDIASSLLNAVADSLVSRLEFF